MAKATDKSSTAIYVPPGFRRLTDVVAVKGLDTVRDQLASGEPAFGLSLYTGKIIEIPLEMWRTHAALEVLEHGIWSRRNHSGGPYSYRLGPEIEDFVVLVSDKPTALAGGAKPAPAATPKPLGPKEWLAQACEAHPQQRNETDAAYARQLFKLPGVPPSWKKWTTVLRRLNDRRRG